jgi:hypothetical protein
MPTLLSTFNPGGGEVKMRYQEPYVTEGLNAKFARIVPRGTHRGFRLSTNAGALTVTISADTTTLDHVAQYLTTDGHALTIRRTGGDFAVTLPANNTYVIAIYATYVVGSATTAVLNAYTLTEYNALTLSQQQELVILGTVVSPVAGVIPAANITHFRRSWAYLDVGQDAVPFLPLLTDPGFELSGLPSSLNVSGIPGIWTYTDSSGGPPSLNGKYTTTDPTGENQFTLTSTAPGTFTATLAQDTNYLPVQVGQTIRAILSIKNLSIPTSGTITVQPVYLDQTFTPVTCPDIYSISLAGVDATYRTIDTTFQVPANALYVSQMLLSVTAVAWTIGADVFRLNAFQALLETGGPSNAANGRSRIESARTFYRLMSSGLGVQASDAVLRQGGTLSVGDPFPYSGQKVQLDRADLLNDATHIPPAFYPHGPVVAGTGLTDQSLPRLLAVVQPGVANRSLVIGTKHPTAKGEFRIYVTDTGQTEMTNNAVWDPVALHWVQDDSTKASVRWTIQNGGFTPAWVVECVSSGTGTFTSWGTFNATLDVSNAAGSGLAWLNLGAATGGSGKISLQGDNSLGDFGPSVQLASSYNMAHADAPLANTLYAKNIVKAWGTITPSAISPYATLTDGFNVASITPDTLGNSQTVTFAAALASSTYAVVTTPYNTIGGVMIPKISISIKSTGSFIANFFDTTTVAGPYNNSNAVNGWDFVVLGA